MEDLSVPTFVYRPDHPLASKSGMVDKYDALYYDELSNKKPSKRMMRGNTPVSVYFNSDTMEPTRHMASGKYFTSKSKFRRETKAYGCIEVGNETTIKPRQPIKLDKRQRREDIKKAIHELKNGRKV